MKYFKLCSHQKSFSPEDLILNPKEHPDIKVGDVVEIYHPEDEGCRLLLQVSESTDKNSSLSVKETISVESNIATAFNLRVYADVIIRVVNSQSVALDSVEITFKDQYMGRSEMWRLKQYLTNTCVYLNKKIEHCQGSIRCQVYEMWSQGDRVACGVINEDTKVVFRSSTSMVYLFIQMSSEMWDFDIHGDLYFEKSVNGFLTDLFLKWKKLGSNHEVTIVLFSRTFYNAKKLSEFPSHMHECLEMDYKGRFYEDFYRVAIQNERNDDWSTILVQLRRLFTSYQATVLNYHTRPGCTIPQAYNSTSAQGNFLEVLNISLNVFEKHYLDRSFDRTGQLSVVITPGVGVFEVDRELTNITKQRIIDNGVGSDLVCVGEQPLHAVPLLKFHNKDSSVSAADDYSMPHWINLSFYSTNKKIAYSSFIPRIKLPPLNYENNFEDKRDNPRLKITVDKHQNEYIHNSLFDYDAYDNQIFILPQAQSTCSVQKVSRAKKTSVPCLEGFGTCTSKEWESMLQTPKPVARRKMSDPDIHHGIKHVLASSHNGSPNLSEVISIADKNSNNIKVKINKNNNNDVGGGGNLHLKQEQINTPIIRTGRALINPFDPSHVTIKLTSNRRRWTHIFPKGPTGVFIQQHHYQAIPTETKTKQNQLQYNYLNFDSSDFLHTSTCSLMLNKSKDLSNLSDLTKRKVTTLHSAAGPLVTVKPSKSLTLLWGATGEQEWTPALTTAGKIKIGVDWKSLTIPACLPITTDYFPDQRALHNDYVVSDYTLLPEDVNADYAQNRAIYKKPLTTEEVFKELVSQRLAQGFQIIVVPDKSLADPPPKAPCCGGNYLHNKQQQQQQQQQHQQQQHQQQQHQQQQQSLVQHVNHQQKSIQLLKNQQHLHNQKQQQQQQPLQKQLSSILKVTSIIETNKEYFLSIGRIFHTIALSGSSVITVTRYRPRHPYPPINIDYRFRFHAPQHDTYEISGVKFTTEKLENFNWNYMDQYICTRGDTDYPMLENLKYWRYRMYLLPKEHPAIKKITESYPLTRCDIYQDYQVDGGVKQQIDDFMRFVESCLNKLKKNNYNKPKEYSGPQKSHLTQRRHSTSILSRPTPNQVLGNSPFRDRVGSIRLPEKRPRSGSKVMEKGPGRVSPATEAAAAVVSSSNVDSSNSSNTTEDNDDQSSTDIKFTINTALTDILEAMKHLTNGLTFFANTPSLPSCTFTSYDAVNWLQNRTESVTISKSIEILESMRLARMLCHASGDPMKPIIYGYYLYYIVAQDTESKDYTPPLGDLEAFENEWVEVELRVLDDLDSIIGGSNNSSSGGGGGGGSSSSINNNNNNNNSEKNVPKFLQNTIERNIIDGQIYKQTHLETDVLSKSDRVEWGHARYHRYMTPGYAFEIVVQWLTASGPIVFDLINGWCCRKAPQCNFQLISIPSDPLAEPFTDKSDPLRGPIFVPLNLTAIKQNPELLFEDLKGNTTDRFIMFQEAIIARFGFMPCYVETKIGLNQASLDHQYVHCTGHMFILLVGTSIEQRHRLNSIGANQRKLERNNSRHNYSTSISNNSSSSKQYLSVSHESISSLRYGIKNPEDISSSDRKYGFLWSWNHMISNKKWKSMVISDGELFQLRMLKDFKDFCSNHDNRLVNFWDECWLAKENASLQKS